MAPPFSCKGSGFCSWSYKITRPPNYNSGAGSRQQLLKCWIIDAYPHCSISNRLTITLQARSESHCNPRFFGFWLWYKNRSNKSDNFLFYPHTESRSCPFMITNRLPWHLHVLSSSVPSLLRITILAPRETQFEHNSIVAIIVIPQCICQEILDRRFAGSIFEGSSLFPHSRIQ